MILPRGYRSPDSCDRDQAPSLCVNCAQPIPRLTQAVGAALGLDTAWLASLEAIDHEAYLQLRDYLNQLVTLWWWTWWAMDGASRGNGVDEIRTHQRGGDPTGDKIRDGEWDEKTGEQLAEPTIADDQADELRERCRREAKRLRDAATNLRRYLARLELATSPNLEREQQRGLRDNHGRLVP